MSSPQVSRIIDVGHTSRATLREQGRAERERIDRATHAEWSPNLRTRDPLDVLTASNASREPELVPIRMARMAADAFSFFRGAPAVMASDLSETARTSICPQICGDAHLLNFGSFATPERLLIFDLNDFDETLPGPFEWDLKRLTTSFVVAARAAGLGDDPGREAAQVAVRRYAAALTLLSASSTLDIWYSKASAEDVLRLARGRQLQRELAKTFAKARRRDMLQAVAKLTTRVDGRRVLVEKPPLLVHTTDTRDPEIVQALWHQYRGSLRGDRRHLIEQYEVRDVARKVVGVGSVGTRCYVALMKGRAHHDYLLLQIKEAQASVLEPYVGASEYDHHGERVVVGQRLMQAASDLFLGWGRSPYERDFYVRQLRDMKQSVDAPSLPGDGFLQYAALCGATLARAHANSCDPALISGYVGKGKALAKALSEFAVSYADQNDADHAQLREAVADGRLEAAQGIV